MARVSKAIMEAVRSVVEPLEVRRLLTTVNLSGEAGTNNDFYVRLNATTGNLDFYVNSVPGSGTPEQSVPIAQVSRVHVQDPGEDSANLTIDAQGAAFALEVAGSGADGLNVALTRGNVTIDSDQIIGALSVATGGAVIMNGIAASLWTPGGLTIGGSFQHSAGLLTTPTLTISQGGVFNDAGGSIGNTSGVAVNNSGTFKAAFAGSLASTTGTFNNDAGHLIVDVGAGNTANVGMAFVAHGVSFNLVSGTLRLADWAQSYSLHSDLAIDGTAGTLNVTSLDLGGSYTQTGGTLAIDQSFEIRSNDPSATMQLSGGTLNVAQGLALNCFTYGQATLHQSGGTVLAAAVAIGQSSAQGGVWDQTGGTNYINELDISPFTTASVTSSYNLSGGSSTINTLVVGFAGTGVFNLSGTGALTVTTENVGSWGGNGTFNQTGGTHNVGQLSVGCVLDGTGTYNFSGGSLTAVSEYIAFGNYQPGMVHGTFVQTGGTNTATSNLAIAYGGNSQGAFEMRGGTLTVPWMVVGRGTSGSFLQTAGQTIVTDALVVGDWTGQLSTLTLSGGSLVAQNNAYIGFATPGTVNQAGGTFSVANNLYISGDGADGDVPDGHGTYNLSGTGQLSTANTFVGYGSDGVMNQTGGTQTTNYFVYNGPSGTVGTINKTGGVRNAVQTVNVLQPSANGAQVVDEGSPYTLNLSATSSVGNNAIASWAIDWGDQTNDSLNGNPSSAQHTYLAGGVTRTIHSTAAGGGQSYPSAPVPVLVHDVPASSAPVQDITVNAGDFLHFTTTYADPGTGETHTATIDWGDGNLGSSDTYGSGVTIQDQGQSGLVTGSHTYNRHGVYTAMLHVADSAGAISELPIHITVNYVEPRIAASVLANPTSIGAQATLRLDATGPEKGGITGWRVDWGDGTPAETLYSPGTHGGTRPPHDSLNWARTHTYAVTGTYEIHAWAIDSESDSHDAGIVEEVVKLPAPNVSSLVVSNASVGVASTVTAVATPFENNSDPLTYEWSLIDPADPANPISLVTSNPSASFTPLHSGNWTVSLTVTDSLAFAPSVVTQDFVVLDAAPLVINGPTVLDVGGTANFTASGTATNQLTWSAKLAGTGYATAAGSQFNFSPTAPGTYEIQLDGADSVGDTYSASLSLTVTRLPPRIKISGPSTSLAGKAITFAAKGAGGDSASAELGYSWSLLNADGSSHALASGVLPNNLSTFTIPGVLSAGTYQVRLTATDTILGGSSSTASFDFTLIDVPSARNIDWGAAPSVAVGASASEVDASLVPSAIVRQDDGKIIIAAHCGGQEPGPSYLARFNADLTLDTTFGPDHSGTIMLDFLPGPYLHWNRQFTDIFAIAINPVNKDVVVTGQVPFQDFAEFGSSLAVGEYATTTRFSSNGELIVPGQADPDFNGGLPKILVGNNTLSAGFDVAVTGDGLIYIAGVAATYGLPAAQLAYATANGNPSYETHAVISDFLLLRLTPTGALDDTFNGSGIAEAPQMTGLPSYAPFDPSAPNSSSWIAHLITEDGAQKIVFADDGSILLAGSIDRYALDSSGHFTGSGTDEGFGLAKYHANGTLDRNFGTNGSTFTSAKAFTGHISDIAQLSAATFLEDGSILTAGTAEESQPHVVLAKYTATGALDESFGVNGIVQRTDLEYQFSGNSSYGLQSGDGEDFSHDFGERDGDSSLTFDSDGRLVASLNTYTDGWKIYRLDQAGANDLTFGANNDGIVGIPTPKSTRSPRVSFEATNRHTSVLVSGDDVLGIGLLHGTQNIGFDMNIPVVVRYRPLPIPAADNLHAVESQSAAIALKWKNTGFGQEGYKIERAASLQSLNTSAVLIGTVGPDQTDFVDTTVQSNQSYYYRVVPFSSAGDGTLVLGTSTSAISIRRLPSSQALFSLQEVVGVPLDGSSVDTTTALQAGKTYLLTVSGRAKLRSNLSVDGGFWSSDTDRLAFGRELAGNSVGLSVSRAGGAPVVPDWSIEPSEDDTYTISIVGDGEPLSFHFASPIYLTPVQHQQYGNEPFQIKIFAAPRGETPAVSPPATPSGQPQLRITVPTADSGATPAVVSRNAAIDILAAAADGTEVPWQLWLKSSAGDRHLIAHGDSSIGQYGGQPAAVATVNPSAFADGIYTLELTTNFSSGSNYSVSQPIALERPVLRIGSPSIDRVGLPAKLSDNTPLSVLAAAPDDTPVPWVLKLTSSSGHITTLASGDASVGHLPGETAKVLTFNPAEYANGDYTLTLATAYADGNTNSSVVRKLQIATSAKTGTLVVPVVDATVGTAAGQITIGRSYDSGRIDRPNGLTNLGPGWTFGLLDSQLEITGQNDLHDPTQTTPVLRAGDLVSLSTPDGVRHVFSFDPVPISEPMTYSGSVTGILYSPHFIAMDGSGATLTIPQTSIGADALAYDAASDEYLWVNWALDEVPNEHNPWLGVADVGFNPARRILGVNNGLASAPLNDQYQLTLSDGTSYVVNAANGQFESVTNQSGVKVSYAVGEGGSVVGTTQDGRPVVTVSMDGQHRVTSVLVQGQDPISYTYDGAGNLKAVQNRDGSKSLYTYQSDSGQNLLTGLVNAAGQTTLQARYSAAGSLDALVTAKGVVVPIDQSALGKSDVVQTVIDPAGDITQNVYNERYGTLVRKIQTLTGSNGSVTGYVVTVTDLSYVDDELGFVSAVRPMDVETLQKLRTYASFKIQGDDPTGQRYSQSPATDSWTKEVQFDTSDNGDDAGRQQIVSSAERVSATGIVKRTIFSNFKTFNTQLETVKPQLTVTQYETSNGSSSTDITTQSKNYTSYDINGNILYDLTAVARDRDINDVGGWLASGTQYNYVDGQLQSQQQLTGTITAAGAVTNLVTSATKMQNVYYSLGEAMSTPGAVYGGLKYGIDAAGQETYHAYDASGHSVLAYVYKTWTDPDGNAINGWVGTTSKYDAAGRLVETWAATYRDNETDAALPAHTLAVATGGPAGIQVNASIDPVYSPLRPTEQISYNTLGQVAQKTDEYGRATTYTYDVMGNTIRVVNPDLTETRTVYDALNRAVWSMSNFVPVGGNSANPNVTTHTVYDQLGRVVATETYTGTVIEISGQHIGSATVERATVADNGTFVSATQTRYDAAGNVIESVSPNDGQLSDRLRTGNIYYPNGQVQYSGILKASAPDGGRQVAMSGVSTQAYLLSDFASYTETDVPVYDATQELFYTRSIDQNGHHTDNYVDAKGRAVRTVFDDGSFNETLYSRGNSAVSRDEEGDFIANPTGWAGIPAGGREVVQIKQRKENELPVATINVYDEADHLTDVYLPAVVDADLADNPNVDPVTRNTPVNPHWTYLYDTAGNEIDQISPKEQATYRTWVNQGSGWHYIDGTYDEDGNPITEGHYEYTPLAGVTAFAYDQNGHQVRQTLPDGEVQSWAYDTHQRIATHADFDGNLTTDFYEPDSGAEAGLLRQVVYTAASGSGKSDQTVTYTYDELNRQETVADNIGTTTNGYDAFGNLIESDTPQGDIHYGFDPVTQNHTDTWTANTSVHYGHDPQDRLASVTVNKLNGQALATPLTTNYTYDDAGNKRTETLPTGEVTTYAYDNLNRLTGLLEKKGSTTLFDQSYTLNADGTRSGSDQAQRQSDGSNVTTHTDWTYDADGRLTGETASSSATNQSYADVFAYDLDNNRAEQVHTGPAVGPDQTTTYAYNGDDQLKTETSSLTVTGETDNFYDDNGSLISSVTNGQTTTYTYDARNKLVAFAGNGKTASYVYDNAGNRVGETTGGNTTLYVTDTQNPTGYSQSIEQKATANAVPAVTNLLGDRVFGQNVGTSVPYTVKYLLTDGHGSTWALLSFSGTVAAVYTYDAFGGAINFNPSTAATPFLFGGDAVYDSVSGLCLHGNGIRARSATQFVQRDDFAGFRSNPITLNKYIYGYQNSVSLRDPTGYLGEEEYLEAAEAENALNVERLGQAVYDQAEAYETIVYQATEDGVVKYIGITKDFAARAARHLATKGIEIEPIEGLGTLARSDARAVEQVLIEMYGLGKNGGSLLNLINSIAASNEAYPSAILRGLELLTEAGVI